MRVLGPITLLFLIFLILCLLLKFSRKSAAQVPQSPPADPGYAKACYEPSTSQDFQTNLATLLFALNSTDPTSYVTGFNRTIIGDGEDRLYGLFFCRADLGSAACEACVSLASQKIVEVCPDHKESTIWYEYDKCSLTYSYKNIFNTVSDTRAWWFDSENVSLPTDLGIILNSTLDRLIPEAANALVEGKKFAVKKTKFTESEPLYTLAQCTPDLSPENCRSCLQKADDWGLPRIADGGVALLTNCIMRFEKTAFYDETAIKLLLPDLDTSSLSTGEIVAIVVSCSATVVLFIILSFYLWNRALKMEQIRRYENVAKDIKTAEQFDFAAIQAATNNFSTDNKLGEGGFGVVYKGVLHDGQEVAVKRLFNSTSQGIIEFKNEVNVVAKLQHRNLVRLLGFCVEKGEKILVFEYMPNKSLDYFLVDSEQQRGLLDWPRRYSIISGIAQGMLYLHEYSRLRIIHRDLKTGNILLDADMHPKISDFGMARIVGYDQTQETASKVAGTLGYMPPEYLRIGHFSVKSDVYSFGMLMLEIIVGKKNSSFYDLENAEDLPSYVWKHWKESAPLEVLDPILKDSSGKEVIRCIHISLLCLQQNPDDRPTMGMIDEMLKNFAFDLPEPQPPAFFHQDGVDQHHRHENIIINVGPEASVDKQTITLLKAR